MAADVTLDGVYVGLCDWHGQLVWKSGDGVRVLAGEYIWAHAERDSQRAMKSAVASVASLREQCVLEVANEHGEHYRLWMWPLNDPDVAICLLAMQIPAEMARLTERERTCLKCLAEGKSTRDIARELDIGLTTVHTHLRRSREKLGLTSAEALIGFAARYFHNPRAGSAASTAGAWNRSG